MDNLEKEILAHRYLYYILNRPILSDREYDIKEKYAKSILPENSPVFSMGSDLESSYPKEVIEFAKKLLK